MLLFFKSSIIEIFNFSFHGLKEKFNADGIAVRPYVIIAEDSVYAMELCYGIINVCALKKSFTNIWCSLYCK